MENIPQIALIEKTNIIDLTLDEVFLVLVDNGLDPDEVMNLLQEARENMFSKEI